MNFQFLVLVVLIVAGLVSHNAMLLMWKKNNIQLCKAGAFFSGLCFLLAMIVLLFFMILPSQNSSDFMIVVVSMIFFPLGIMTIYIMIASIYFRDERFEKFVKWYSNKAGEKDFFDLFR